MKCVATSIHITVRCTPVVTNVVNSSSAKIGMRMGAILEVFNLFVPYIDLIVNSDYYADRERAIAGIIALNRATTVVSAAKKNGYIPMSLSQSDVFMADLANYLSDGRTPKPNENNVVITKEYSKLVTDWAQMLLVNEEKVLSGSLNLGEDSSEEMIIPLSMGTIDRNLGTIMILVPVEVAEQDLSPEVKEAKKAEKAFNESGESAPKVTEKVKKNN